MFNRAVNVQRGLAIGWWQASGEGGLLGAGLKNERSRRDCKNDFGTGSILD
jgi:hypothetical protein